MRIKNKMLKIILALITFIVVISFISSKFIIIKGYSNEKEIIFGIIDAQLTIDYGNIIVNNRKKINPDKKTHGDQLINFANKYYSNLKIYYYDASNENGSVDTNGIIAGLEWMKEKGKWYFVKNYSIV